MSHENTTPTLLASPVMPRLDGVGVEQRAARTLAALGERGPVDLVLCRPELERWARRWLRREAQRAPAGCRSVALGQRLDPLPGESLLRRAALLRPRSDAVAGATLLASRLLRVPRDPRPPPATSRFHAFRLAAADALPDGRSDFRKEIDLDDLESEAARSIADLAMRAGDTAIAALYATLMQRLSALEVARLPRFDRAYVGSDADRAWLEHRMPGLEVRVLPNVVDVAATPRGPRESGPVRFLYVGALGYYPNIDALRRLVERVLPRLRERRPGAFELHVVGRGAPRWLRALLRQRDVVYHGAAPSMSPHYQRADAVVVPLRAGGGTRIKLLEAFAHRVPVISSTLGAHGLDVAHGRHLVIADSDEELALAIERFIDDPDHATPLALEAHRHVTLHHHPGVFSERLRTA
jgi:glycosyltransferase involved in cell wall biosynthesis